MKKILVMIITGYQRFITPFLPPSCRYYPTCSSYFIEALEKHGFFNGTRLGITRILRCNPFHEGGYDPVPDELPYRSIRNLYRLQDRSTIGGKTI